MSDIIFLIAGSMGDIILSAGYTTDKRQCRQIAYHHHLRNIGGHPDTLSVSVDLDSDTIIVTETDEGFKFKYRIVSAPRF